MHRGRNPAAEKQKAKATAACDWTVRELLKVHRAKKLLSLAHISQVSHGRHPKRIEKKLGALTVREIEASHVVAPIEGAGLSLGESNMLLVTTKCLFTHAGRQPGLRAAGAFTQPRCPAWRRYPPEQGHG